MITGDRYEVSGTDCVRKILDYLGKRAEETKALRHSIIYNVHLNGKAVTGQIELSDWVEGVSLTIGGRGRTKIRTKLGKIRGVELKSWED